MNQQNLWIEPLGNVIMARIRGSPTDAQLRECQDRVIQLVQDTGSNMIVYDALEMDPPSVDQVILQQKMQEAVASLGLRRALVVPNTRIAYLARIAFGEGDYRVFYNDLSAALAWVQQSPAGGPDRK